MPPQPVDLFKKKKAPDGASTPQTVLTRPLPVGKPLEAKSVRGRRLTELEQETFDAIGLTDADEVPSNMADLLDEIGKEYLAEDAKSPYTDGTTVSVPEFDPVDIRKLPAEQREAIRAKIQAAVVNEKQARIEAYHDAVAQQAATAVPGLNEAMAMAEQATANQAAKPPEPAVETQPASAPVDTGARPQMTHCPHCEWPLDMLDIPEPEYGVKMEFLHTILGQKPFTKEYSLYDGSVRLVLRTLTTAEADVIYKQAFADIKLYNLQSDLDFWERVNRYRMFLQIVSFKSVSSNGFVHELPNGYSKATNQDCTVPWVPEQDEQTLGPSKTALDKIEEYVTTSVLKTETVFRSVNVICNQFNRLVSKMEAMVDNSDFWKRTAVQS